MPSSTDDGPWQGRNTESYNDYYSLLGDRAELEL